MNQTRFFTSLVRTCRPRKRNETKLARLLDSTNRRVCPSLGVSTKHKRVEREPRSTGCVLAMNLWSHQDPSRMGLLSYHAKTFLAHSTTHRILHYKQEKRIPRHTAEAKLFPPHSRAHVRSVQVQAEEGTVVSHVVRLHHAKRVGHALALPLLLRQVHHRGVHFPVQRKPNPKRSHTHKIKTRDGKTDRMVRG